MNFIENCLVRKENGRHFWFLESGKELWKVQTQISWIPLWLDGKFYDFKIKISWYCNGNRTVTFQYCPIFQLLQGNWYQWQNVRSSQTSTQHVTYLIKLKNWNLEMQCFEFVWELNLWFDNNRSSSALVAYQRGIG